MCLWFLIDLKTLLNPGPACGDQLQLASKILPKYRGFKVKTYLQPCRIARQATVIEEAKQHLEAAEGPTASM
jgi:hypothetical protein